MRKNFTRLISSITQHRKYVTAVTSLILILGGSAYLMAAVGISITGTGAYTLSADLAATNTFTPITNVVIKEASNNDFASRSSYKLVLTVPVGWVFNSSGVSAARNTGEVNLTTTPTYISDAAGVRTIEFPLTTGNGNQTSNDQITISGLSVKSTNGLIDPTQPKLISVQIINTTGTTPVTEATSTPISLSQTHGTARKLAFSQQPTATNIYTPITPAPAVLIQDQFGNTVTSANSSISIALSNNPSSGVLGGSKSVVAVNGVATFPDLSIDASGIGYTLKATSGALTEVTSAAFTINSSAPILESIQAPCITVGDPEQVITLIGSNFARNASARINNNARLTEFVSPTELRMTLLASDLATAGNKTITVRNVNPSGDNSGGRTLVIREKFENTAISGITEEVCTGQSYSYTGLTGYSSYEWSVTDGARIVSGQGTRSISVVYDEVPTSGIVTLTVTAENACGISGTQAFDIIVKQAPPAVISIDPSASNVICEGSSVELKAPVAPAGEPKYTYQWRLNNTDIDEANSDTYAATTAGTYTVVVSAANGCSRTSTGFNVGTTTPLTQGDITGITSYCQKAPASALTATVGGGLNQSGTTSNRTKTYLWEQSATGAEGTWEDATGTSTAATYTPSTATAGTLYYRRKVYAGGCENTTAPVAVTVTPEITNNSISGTQTVCSGSPIALLDGEPAIAGNETVEYLWEQSTTGTSGSWEPAEGVNNQEDYQPASRTVSATSSLFYQRRVKAGECTTYSNRVSVKVTAMPVATITQGTNTYFCYPGQAVLTAQAVIGYTYKWYRVVEEGDDVEVGATQSISVGRVGEESAVDRYYVVATQVTDGNSCSTTSAPIIVQETVVGNNILNGEDQLICYGATPEMLEGSIATSTLGNVSYQWQISSDGNDFRNITTGGTAINLSLGAHIADRWYRRIATVGSCSITSDAIKVGVKPELRVTNIPASATSVCNNTPFEFTPVGSVESATFTWTRDAVEGISNPAVTNGVGGINETLVNTTNAPIDVTYIYTTSGNENCTGVPQNLVVRVNPTPQLSTTLTPDAICSGANFSYTARNTVAGSTRYDWVREEVAGISTTAPASGSATSTTGASISHLLTNTTADPINVKYTFTLTTNGCSSGPQEVVVTVNPRPQLSSTLTPAALCSGTAFTYTPQSETAGATFSWTRAAVTGISNAAVTTPVEGGINEALINTTATPKVVTYRFITSANGCSGTVESVQVTVNPSPELSSPLTASVCSGATFEYTPTSLTADAGFTWSRAASGGNVAASGEGVISEVLTNTSTAPLTVTYEITTRANGCQGESQNLVVTVNPRPVLSSPLTASVCSNALFNYTPQSETANAIFTWTRAAVAGISNAAVTTPRTGSVSETLVNTTANPINVTYVYTTSVNGCAGIAQNVVVRVNPQPVLSSTLSPNAICSGTTFSYTPQSETAGATFSWTRATVTGISNAAVTIPVQGGVNETLVNTGATPVTVTYRYTTFANGCQGSSTQDVKVVVNPSPRLSSTLTPTAVCSGSTFTYNPASATPGAIYTWTRAAVPGISNEAVTTPVAGGVSETLVNTTTSAINVTYVFTTTANGCSGTPQNVVVRVNPKPVATFSGVTDGQVVYSDGGDITLTPTGATGGTFSIVSPAGTSGLSTSGTLDPCIALGSATEKAITIRYTVAQGSGDNRCTNFEEKTITLKRSNYTVIILADPYPTCRGQITEYTAYVYKDATRVIYPYLADANGIAVDEKGNRLGDQTLPITNPDYPFPNRESMPKILYDNAWRYFQPVVEGGTLMPATNFNYQWTKNRTNFFGPNSPTIQNAGLSSLDYYAVEVTSKNSGCAQPITSKMTNRMYTSATVNYEVALGSDRTTICRGGGITLTADLNDAFAFWGDISLRLYWMLDRGGVISQLGETVYRSGDQIQFPTSGPAGGFLDGDKVFVEFSSALDQFNNANKCARGFITNIIPITVVGEQTMAAGGAYCAGGAGIPVTMNGSQQGVFYQLKRDGQPVGSPVAGTGGPLNFGNQTVAGAYTVEALAAVGTPACLEFGPVNVYVTPLPTVQTLTAANNGEFCAGGAGVPITLAGSQPGVSYQLVRTAGTSTSNVGSPVIGDGQQIVFPNQTIAGTYRVIATTVQTDGTIASCPVTMGNVTVTINPLPTVAVNSPSACAGSRATVTATPGVGTGPFTYTWTVPAGWTGPVPTTASFQTDVPGTYTVRVTDSKSCSSSAAATSIVTVNPLPEVAVNNPTICAVAGQMATVSADVTNGTGPFTYTWTVPAGATNPGNVASFQTDVAGNYTVRITDSRGCAASAAATSTVTVNPVLNATGDILIYDAENNEVEAAEMKIGEKYTFRVKSNIVDANDTDVASIKWYMGDGLEENWVHMQTGGTEFVMTEPMPAVKVSIRCEIPTNPGTCYNVLANLFMVSTEVVVPLPVELIYFKAEKRGNDVAMEWATASEKDNKGFEVQLSTDGKNFRSLGFVESRVINSSIKQVYTFVDKENGKYGTRYYRLKQIDLDGKFEYFSTKAIQFGAVVANKVKAYPNPFHSEIELSIDAEVEAEVLVTVTNATGQQLLQRTIKVEKGANIEKLTLDPTLPRGIYIISTRMGGFNNHFKLLKQ